MCGHSDQGYLVRPPKEGASPGGLPLDLMRQRRVDMQYAVFVGLLVLAAVLFVLNRMNIINGDTLSRLADIAAVVSFVAAIIFYVLSADLNGQEHIIPTPATDNAKPTATHTSEPTPTNTPTLTYTSTFAQEESWIDQGSSAHFFDGDLVISLQKVSDDGKVGAVVASPAHRPAQITDEPVGHLAYYQADDLYEILITQVIADWKGARFLVTRMSAAEQVSPEASFAPADTPQSQSSNTPEPIYTAMSPVPTGVPAFTSTPKPPESEALPTTSVQPPTPRTPEPPTNTPVTPTKTPAPTITVSSVFSFNWDTQITCSYVENRVNNLNSVHVQVTGFIMARPDGGAELTISEVPAPDESCPPGGWCGPIEDVHNHYSDFHGVVWGTTWVHYQGVEVASKSFGPTPLSCDP